jgi:hypothetical protein
VKTRPWNFSRKHLSYRVKVLGELHPYTFETLNNLANLQQEMGDLG